MHQPPVTRIPVVALVDWNCQLREVRDEMGQEPGPLEVLEHVAQQLSRALARADQRLRFEIRLRLYCGWHREKKPTSRRNALGALSEEDLYALSYSPRMVFRDLDFGERAVRALRKRRVLPPDADYLNTKC
jgi:hypothetical protein